MHIYELFLSSAQRLKGEADSSLRNMRHKKSQNTSTKERKINHEKNH